MGQTTAPTAICLPLYYPGLYHQVTILPPYGRDPRLPTLSDMALPRPAWMIKELC